MTTIAMAMATTHAMVTATRWWATKRAMARAARVMRTATKRARTMAARAMAMAMKRAIVMDREGNVDDGKSNGTATNRARA